MKLHSYTIPNRPLSTHIWKLFLWLPSDGRATKSHIDHFDTALQIFNFYIYEMAYLKYVPLKKTKKPRHLKRF